MSPLGRSICLSLALLLSAAGAGCRWANLEAENDRLREEVMDLTDQVTGLKARNRELIAELSQASTAPGSLPDAVRQATPRVAGIEIDRLSHARDEDEDGMPETILVYITSRDGRERFVQLVGELVVTATVAHGKAPAVTVGSITLNPAELRDAYRNGFMGTHYSVTVPIDVSALSRGDLDLPCLVCATFEDGLMGQHHTAERSVPLHRGR
ncbi:MAG: hypothetical protein JSV91_03065 [Phycisphaerales bacterium]|nr:MAG: hypothetical protein JSV91_03065 [Phycisphaerales bacterium]